MVISFRAPSENSGMNFITGSETRNAPRSASTITPAAVIVLVMEAEEKRRVGRVKFSESVFEDLLSTAHIQHRGFQRSVGDLRLNESSGSFHGSEICPGE